MADEGKQRFIRYQLVGRVEVTKELDVQMVLEQLGKLKAKAQEFSEAAVKISMPRLTSVKL